MWMLRDCDWQMKAPRLAAWSMMVFCLISHTVLYSSFSSSGMPFTFWMEPRSAMICRRTSCVHRPDSMRSCSRCLFTTGNSPASTRRLYTLDVKGSVDSLLPRICAVEAVGMGASSSELRRPCLTTRAFSASQSKRPEEGFTPHMSNCSTPLLAGEPAKLR
jgi:hypothetical protein